MENMDLFYQSIRPTDTDGITNIKFPFTMQAHYTVTADGEFILNSLYLEAEDISELLDEEEIENVRRLIFATENKFDFKKISQ